jgi:hypothetical protein
MDQFLATVSVAARVLLTWLLMKNEIHTLFVRRCASEICVGKLHQFVAGRAGVVRKKSTTALRIPGWIFVNSPEFPRAFKRWKPWGLWCSGSF